MPSSVPRRTERLLLAVASPLPLAFTFFAQVRHIRIATIVGSQVVRVTRLKVHVMVRPEGIASPSPTRTFTFELSPPKSPPRDVENHYAGNSANSRDRTFTGKTSSIMGGEQRRRDRRENRLPLISASSAVVRKNRVFGRFSTMQVIETWLAENDFARFFLATRASAVTWIFRAFCSPSRSA